MSAIGVPVWVYGATLIALWAASTAVEGRALARVAAALLANWCAHMVHWFLTGDPSPYWFSILVDTATAVVVLSRPSGRMQAIVGWTLLMQITIHCAYALHMLTEGYVERAAYKYWDWLDWIAVAQIFLVGGGLIGGFGRPFIADNRHRADAHDPPGMVHP